MAQLVQVTTQRIFGAFNPQTNQIVGVQTSGETPYQNIPNALITQTYAGVRTATAISTQTVFAMGHNTVSDGNGGTFAYNASDTSSGCVCTGSSAGTVLTVSAVSSGTVVVGQTLCSSVTGLPLAIISSFGTGSGGVGTYNLSAPVNQAGPFLFLIDNNSTVLVSGDGSRWDLTTVNPTVTGITGPTTVNNAGALTTLTVNPPASGTQPTLTLNPNTSAANAGGFLCSASVNGNVMAFQLLNNNAGTGASVQWIAQSAADLCTFAEYNTGGAPVLGANDPGGARTSLWTAGNTPIILGTNSIARVIINANGEVALQGTPTNDNAPAGFFGEFQTASPAGTSLVNNTNTNIATLSLTAGDWDVMATVTYTNPTTAQSFVTGLSTTSATFGGTGTFQCTPYASAGTTLQTSPSFVTPVIRFSLSATTTVYCVVAAVFTGSCTATPFMRARRVR